MSHEEEDTYLLMLGLLRAGVKPNVGLFPLYIRSLLTVVRTSGTPVVRGLLLGLLKAGAKPNVVDALGQTPLHVLARSEDTLIRGGVDNT
jgi:hypothetical protein